MIRLPALASSVLLVALCAAGCTGGAADSRTVPAGPLSSAEPHVWSVPADDVGHVFSDGLETVRNQGAQPIHIDSIQPKGGSEVLSFLGARIGLPGRPDDFNQLMPEYPPTAVPSNFQVLAEGAVLQPGELYMIILGYEITKDAYAVRTSVVVKYHAGVHRYELEIPAVLVACPHERDEEDCVGSISSAW